MAMSLEQVTAAFDEIFAPESTSNDVPLHIDQAIQDWEPEFHQRVIIDLHNRALRLDTSTPEDWAVAAPIFQKITYLIQDLCECYPERVFANGPYFREYITTFFQTLFKFQQSKHTEGLNKPIFWTSEGCDTSFHRFISETHQFDEVDLFQTIKPYFSTGPNDNIFTLASQLGQFVQYYERMTPYTILPESASEFFNLQIHVITKVIALIKASHEEDKSRPIVPNLCSTNEFHCVQKHATFVQNVEPAYDIEADDDRFVTAKKRITDAYDAVLPTLLPLSFELNQLMSTHTSEVSSFANTATLRAYCKLYGKEKLNELIATHVPDAATNYPATVAQVEEMWLVFEKEAAELQARLLKQ